MRPRLQRTGSGRRTCSGWTGWLTLGAIAAWGPNVAAQQVYVCPPDAQGVPGLTGGPKFTESVPPDGFAAKLDDPRWNGAWRQDFPTGSSIEAGARILKEGNFLYLSLEAKADPDGAAINSDGIFFGLSRDGQTAEMVKVTMTAAPPLTNAIQISSINWWKTTDSGATPWPKQGGPLPWASTATIHDWSGSGTGTGSAWAFNLKIDLAAVGTHLDGGAPLSSNFYLWFEINILNGTVSYPVDWPPGTNLFFDSMNQAILVAGANAWGNVYPVDTGNCPIGVSIDPMHIGATPITAGVPSTTVHYGPGQPPNDLVALLIPGSMAIPNNSVKARYRIANWPSVVGTGGDWHDLAPSAGGGVPGTINNIGSQTTFHCVNPPDTSDTACYQLPSGAPTNQCLLVELSQANGSGVQFVHDSAYVCLDYTDGSKDAGAPDASGSDGASDALGTDANTPGDVSADLPRDAFDERDVGPAPDVTAGDDGAGRSDVGVADTDGDVSKADGNGTDAPNDVALDSNSRLDSSNDVGADGTAGAGGAPGDSSAEGGPSGQDGSGGATAPDAKNDSDAALGPVVDRDGSACICAMPGYDRANGRGRSFALWGLVILASSRARAMRRRREREFLANQRLS